MLNRFHNNLEKFYNNMQSICIYQIIQILSKNIMNILELNYVLFKLVCSHVVHEIVNYKHSSYHETIKARQYLLMPIYYHSKIISNSVINCKVSFILNTVANW